MVHLQRHITPIAQISFFRWQHGSSKGQENDRAPAYRCGERSRRKAVGQSSRYNAGRRWGQERGKAGDIASAKKCNVILVW